MGDRQRDVPDSPPPSSKNLGDEEVLRDRAPSSNEGDDHSAQANGEGSAQPEGVLHHGEAAPDQLPAPGGQRPVPEAAIDPATGKRKPGRFAGTRGLKPKKKAKFVPRPKSTLKVRAAKIQEFLVEHPDATLDEAGRYAGFEKRPGEQASHTLKAWEQRSMQQEMARLMEEDEELSNQALIFKLREGLRSMQVSRSFDKSGNLAGTYSDPDMLTRARYLQMVGKWKGLELNKTELSGPGGGAIPVETTEALRSMSKEELTLFLGMMVKVTKEAGQ